MPTPAIVIVPGITGSSLLNRIFVNQGDRVWLDLFGLAHRDLDVLSFDRDGATPLFPRLTGTIAPEGLLKSYYEICIDFFSSKGKTVLFPYDWRLSNYDNGQLLTQFLRPLLQEGPVYIIAHSMGGLLARFAESNLRTSIYYANLKRVVTISTPHYGTFEAVKALAGISTWVKPYAKIIQGTPLLSLLLGVMKKIAGIAARYKSVLELLPNGWAGPWNGDQVVRDLFNVGTWGATNIYMSQALLDGAKVVQSLFPAPPAAPLFVCVAGINNPTVSGLKNRNALNFGSFYSVDQNGDGTVPQTSALLNGMPAIFTPVSHAAMPSNYALLNAIWNNRDGGPVPDLVLGF